MTRGDLLETLLADPGRVRDIAPDAAADLLVELAFVQSALATWVASTPDTRSEPAPQRSAHGLLSLRDMAERLNVSERTVRREVAAGRLNCVRIGRRLLFDPKDVSRFVAARKE